MHTIVSWNFWSIAHGFRNFMFHVGLTLVDRFYMLTTYCRDFPKADCRRTLGAYGTRIVQFDAQMGAIANISLPGVVIPNSGYRWEWMSEWGHVRALRHRSQRASDLKCGLESGLGWTGSRITGWWMAVWGSCTCFIICMRLLHICIEGGTVLAMWWLWTRTHAPRLHLYPTAPTLIEAKWMHITIFWFMPCTWILKLPNSLPKSRATQFWRERLLPLAEGYFGIYCI